MKRLSQTFKITFGLLLLLMATVSSCKKTNDGNSDANATSNLTGTIDGKSLSVTSSGLSSTYYSDGDAAANSFLTDATIDASGSTMSFFVPDVGAGTVTITPKLGTSSNPGSPDLKIEATTTTVNVQAYIVYRAGGNVYYAVSGTITTTYDNTRITIKWNLTFKDATGRTFTSTGSFVIVNYKVVTKPKTEVKDPTPVSAKPTIDNISPTSGAAGDTVSITGTNFSTTTTDDVVMFNGTAAVVKGATTTKIYVVVPAGTSGVLTVKVKNSETTTGPAFTYIGLPTISGITPLKGKAGDEMNITGTNFSTVLTDNVVTINGLAAPVRIATDSRLTLNIPTGVTSGVVAVKVRGRSASAGVNIITTFTLTP